MRRSLLLKVALLCIPMGVWYCTIFAISHPKILYCPLEISDSLCSPPFWRLADFLILFSFLRVFGGRPFYQLKFLTVPEPRKDLQNTTSIRNSMETAPEFDYDIALCTQRSARQSCKIINATLDPLYPCPTAFVDRRATLHVKGK